jgi:hypothetical protein
MIAGFQKSFQKNIQTGSDIFCKNNILTLSGSKVKELPQNKLPGILPGSHSQQSLPGNHKLPVQQMVPLEKTYWPDPDRFYS